MRAPLVIGPAEREAIAELVARASVSATPYATMKALAQQSTTRPRRDFAGLNRALTILIPIGYIATLTHEEHKPGVMCRHLSVSVKDAKYPSLHAIAELLTVFGFVNRVGEMPSWPEVLEDGAVAINVVEPLDGDVARLRR